MDILLKLPQVEQATVRPASSILIFSDLEIRLREQRVYVKNTYIPLSHYEFFTLAYLARHPYWVFSKEEIYEAVWKEPGEHCGAAVGSVVSQIRRKLGNRKYIQTVIGSGYRFEG